VSRAWPDWAWEDTPKALSGVRAFPNSARRAHGKVAFAVSKSRMIQPLSGRVAELSFEEAGFRRSCSNALATRLHSNAHTPIRVPYRQFKHCNVVNDVVESAVLGSENSATFLATPVKCGQDPSAIFIAAYPGGAISALRVGPVREVAEVPGRAASAVTNAMSNNVFRMNSYRNRAANPRRICTYRMRVPSPLESALTEKRCGGWPIMVTFSSRSHRFGRRQFEPKSPAQAGPGKGRCGRFGRASAVSKSLGTRSEVAQDALDYLALKVGRLRTDPVCNHPTRQAN
jgi:hypothetical protein